jgi:hypothetical protein
VIRFNDNKKEYVQAFLCFEAQEYSPALEKTCELIAGYHNGADRPPVLWRNQLELKVVAFVARDNFNSGCKAVPCIFWGDYYVTKYDLATHWPRWYIAKKRPLQ